jgi:hypothetical protein
MTQSLSLASFLVQAANRLMPAHRKAWSVAMTSEFSALSGQKERLSFAMGYLKTSFVAFATTSTGAAILGRIFMGTGFLVLALWGAFMAFRPNIAAQDMTPAFLGLSGLYFVIGLSPAKSAIMTKRLSMIGALLTMTFLLGLSLSLFPIPTSAYSLAKALCIEALVTMIASSIMASGLCFLEANAPDGDFIA